MSVSKSEAKSSFTSEITLKRFPKGENIEIREIKIKIPSRYASSPSESLTFRTKSIYKGASKVCE